MTQVVSPSALVRGVFAALDAKDPDALAARMSEDGQALVAAIDPPCRELAGIVGSDTASSSQSVAEPGRNRLVRGYRCTIRR
jgi:hypothetical protein